MSPASLRPDARDRYHSHNYRVQAQNRRRRPHCRGQFSVTIREKFLWKGVMLQELPNIATIIGYTNASWTLGADATALLVCRPLKTMTAKGVTSAVPRVENTKAMKSVPALNLSSTYVVRGAKKLPELGDKAPWLPRSINSSDLWSAHIRDGLLFYKISACKVSLPHILNIDKFEDQNPANSHYTSRVKE